MSHPHARPLNLLDEFDSNIILSFVNGILILSIGETIEEVTSGSSHPHQQLAVQQIGADALLQVHPQGIRHVLSGASTSGEFWDWSILNWIWMGS